MGSYCWGRSMKLVWADNEDGYEIRFDHIDYKAFCIVAVNNVDNRIGLTPGQVATLYKVKIREDIVKGKYKLPKPPLKVRWAKWKEKRNYETS